MNILKAKEILDYWFPKDGKADYNKWFIKSKDYDKEIKDKFYDLLKEAEQGKGFGWLVSKDSFLAYIILMDQFSRHIYRGSGDSFKNDNGVLIFVELGMEIYRKQLRNYEFMFALLPYMHSEIIQYQKKGREIFYKHNRLYGPSDNHERKTKNFDKLDDKNNDIEYTQNDNEFMMLKTMKDHLEGHYKTILCFGRFPKRNQVLNRESTWHELQYMNREEVKNRSY
jgi:uncharacterized protein (DUF924 family)